MMKMAILYIVLFLYALIGQLTAVIEFPYFFIFVIISYIYFNILKGSRYGKYGRMIWDAWGGISFGCENNEDIYETGHDW